VLGQGFYAGDHADSVFTEQLGDFSFGELPPKTVADDVHPRFQQKLEGRVAVHSE
jgi:hypothetical protein